MDKNSHMRSDRGLGIIMPLIGCMTSRVRYQASCICEEEGYKLTPEEADTLMLIYHLEGLPQSQLAKILGKDKASITRLMNALVKSGLVGRVQDSNDRRIVRACITEEGKKAFTHIFPKLKALSEQVLDGVSAEEFATIQRVMMRMIENLSALETPLEKKEVLPS